MTVSTATRRFAIVGHRAPGNIEPPLDDLGGAGGRMDVLLRAVNAALFLSHGVRADAEITLHLAKDSNSCRRVRFSGATILGLRPDERGMAGYVAKAIRSDISADGRWTQVQEGLSASAGTLKTTIDEWVAEGTHVVWLEQGGTMLWKPDAQLGEAPVEVPPLGFVLSDDRPFSAEESALLAATAKCRSLGATPLQGHAAIIIVHQLLDLGIEIDLV